MTEPIVLAIIVGLPPTIAALTAAYVSVRKLSRVEKNVEKIEKQTNAMNEQMVITAKKEGELLGKEKAETALAHAATVATAITSRSTPPPALPLTMQPASNEAEVVKWIEHGMALEKARRLREGNGPKT